jgi:hypothetical protein
MDTAVAVSGPIAAGNIRVDASLSATVKLPAPFHKTTPSLVLLSLTGFQGRLDGGHGNLEFSSKASPVEGGFDIAVTPSIGTTTLPWLDFSYVVFA